VAEPFSLAPIYSGGGLTGDCLQGVFEGHMRVEIRMGKDGAAAQPKKVGVSYLIP
jgi:hypothetical protein